MTTVASYLEVAKAFCSNGRYGFTYSFTPEYALSTVTRENDKTATIPPPTEKKKLLLSTWGVKFSWNSPAVAHHASERRLRAYRELKGLGLPRCREPMRGIIDCGYSLKFRAGVCRYEPALRQRLLWQLMNVSNKFVFEPFSVSCVSQCAGFSARGSAGKGLSFMYLNSSWRCTNGYAHIGAEP